MKDFIEIERKYIIEKPKRDILLAQDSYETSMIKQIYLSSDDGVTRRIRERRYETFARYFETFKKRIDKTSAYEDENEISEADFIKKSREIKAGTSPIIKERVTFSFEGKTIEIDIYPQWRNTAIMEIELDSYEEELKIPGFIKVIKEVSGKREYSNAGMSEKFPPEDE